MTPRVQPRAEGFFPKSLYVQHILVYVVIMATTNFIDLEKVTTYKPPRAIAKVWQLLSLIKEHKGKAVCMAKGCDGSTCGQVWNFTQSTSTMKDHMRDHHRDQWDALHAKGDKGQAKMDYYVQEERVAMLCSDATRSRHLVVWLAKSHIPPYETSKPAFRDFVASLKVDYVIPCLKKLDDLRHQLFVEVKDDVSGD